jgi:type IV secretion system protein VirD4
VALIGGSRSGKTTAAIGGILEWQGPAVLCSLSSDLLGATGQWRAGRGDVWVFDPCDVTGRKSATWSPLRGAQTKNGAMRAAKAIAAASPREPRPGQQGDFWTAMAESLLAALLILAANTKERTFSDVVRWVVSTDMPVEGYVGEVPPLLRALKNESDPNRQAAGKWAGEVLEGLWRNDHRTVSSVYATARTMVWPWVDPKVAEVTASCSINLDWLLAGNNTLYVCMPLNDEDRLRPILGGLLNDLVGQAFERHVRTNKPLDPPLLLVLDEAATLCPDRLPAWSSTLAGVGVQLVTTWQSVGQIEAAYGRHSEGILTNHLTKVFYAGMSDPMGLDYASRLSGDEHLPAALSGQAGRTGSGPAWRPCLLSRQPPSVRCAPGTPCSSTAPFRQLTSACDRGTRTDASCAECRVRDDARRPRTIRLLTSDGVHAWLVTPSTYLAGERPSSLVRNSSAAARAAASSRPRRAL